MSQNWNLPDQNTALKSALTSNVKDALNSLLSLHSGASEPTTTAAGMLWYDTTNKAIKQRNAADTAWVTLLSAGAPNNLMTVTIPLGDVSASTDAFLLVAPAAVTVTSLYLVSSSSVAADPSDYWTFQLENRTQAEDLLSAAQSTADGAITADTAYGVTLDQNLDIAAQDVLELQITKAASAPTMNDLVAVLTFAPTGV